MPPLHLAGTLSPWRGNITNKESLLGENGKEGEEQESEKQASGRVGQSFSRWEVSVGRGGFQELLLPAAPELL